MACLKHSLVLLAVFALTLSTYTGAIRLRGLGSGARSLRQIDVNSFFANAGMTPTTQLTTTQTTQQQFTDSFNQMQRLQQGETQYTQQTPQQDGTQFWQQRQPAQQQQQQQQQPELDTYKAWNQVHPAQQQDNTQIWQQKPQQIDQEVQTQKLPSGNTDFNRVKGTAAPTTAPTAAPTAAPWFPTVTTAPTAAQAAAPTAAPTVPATRAPSGPVPGGSGNDILSMHNSYRATHRTPALAWSDSLFRSAQSYANKLASSCRFEHSNVGGVGENLAAGQDSWRTVASAWYDEINSYHYNSPGYSSGTGHATQMLWVGTTELGCATAQGNGCWYRTVYVCHYSPPGNVNSPTYFRQNVLST